MFNAAFPKPRSGFMRLALRCQRWNHVRKILDSLKPMFWGLSFIVVITALIAFPLTETGCDTCARVVFYLLDSPGYEGHRILRQFDEMVEDGPYPLAVKNAQQFEKWEKKAVEWQKKYDAKWTEKAAKGEKPSESGAAAQKIREYTAILIPLAIC